MIEINQYKITENFLYYTFWVTNVFEVECPFYHDIKEDLKTGIYDYWKRDNSSYEIASNVTLQIKDNLYESRFDFFVESNSTAIQRLGEWCRIQFKYCLEKFYKNHFKKIKGNTVSVDVERIKMAEVDIHESWVHITRDRGYHGYHFHPNCSWCAIFYVDVGSVGKKNGYNNFHRAPRQTYLDSFNQTEAVLSHTFTPKNGKMIIFPPHMAHEALPYYGDEDRLVIAMNIRENRRK